MGSQPLSTFPPKGRSQYPRRLSNKPKTGLGRGTPGLSHREQIALRERAATYLDWRERQHAGEMNQGFCIRCYGWPNDPRHWPYPLRYLG